MDKATLIMVRDLTELHKKFEDEYPMAVLIMRNREGRIAIHASAQQDIEITASEVAQMLVDALQRVSQDEGEFGEVINLSPLKH